MVDCWDWKWEEILAAWKDYLLVEAMVLGRDGMRVGMSVALKVELMVSQMAEKLDSI